MKKIIKRLMNQGVYFKELHKEFERSYFRHKNKLSENREYYFSGFLYYCQKRWKTHRYYFYNKYNKLAENYFDSELTYQNACWRIFLDPNGQFFYKTSSEKAKNKAEVVLREIDLAPHYKAHNYFDLYKRFENQIYLHLLKLDLPVINLRVFRQLAEELPPDKIERDLNLTRSQFNSIRISLRKQIKKYLEEYEYCSTYCEAFEYESEYENVLKTQQAQEESYSIASLKRRLKNSKLKSLGG